ncbi:MAG: protein kinase [Deltaproteobacteria bacterium]|nr:protein kinase [Deltaproteobacteria bacterium]
MVEPVNAPAGPHGGAVPTERIGEYTLEGLLGRGASSVVYRAFDPSLERPIALKLLLGEIDAEARERFEIEAKALGRINHANVVHVYSVGTHQGRSYITTELVQGHALSDLLEVRGALTPESVIDVGVQVASALGAATASGVLHRDVKPQNLLLTEDGVVKLADFGIARLTDAPSALTESGTTLGTPHYMSPEQARGEVLDPRADQYSLGATLYHLVTGQPPFDSEHTLSLLWMHQELPLFPVRARRSDCPRGLARAIERMLAKDREERFESFDAVIEALETALDDPGESEVEGPEPWLQEPGPVAPSPDEPSSVEELGATPSASAPERWIAAALILASIAAAILPPSEPRGEGAPRERSFAARVAETTSGGVLPPSGVPPAIARPIDELLRTPFSFDLPIADDPPVRRTEPTAQRSRSGSTSRAEAALIAELTSDAERAARAARLLGERRDQRATPALIALLKSAQQPAVIIAAAHALGRLGDLTAIEPLGEIAAHGPSPEIRAAAESARRQLWHVED